jgi:hypothetical protein
MTRQENEWDKEFAKCRTTAECDRLLALLYERAFEDAYFHSMQMLAVKESIRMAHSRRTAAIEVGGKSRGGE